MEISEQVKTKDIADKPKVLAKQKQLLAERYKLDCRTHGAAGSLVVILIWVYYASQKSNSLSNRVGKGRRRFRTVGLAPSS